MDNMRKRICRNCGTEFIGGPRAWYCPECRSKRKKEQVKHYRKHGFNRHLGDVDICQKCGKEYIITGGLQKYCPDCKDAAIAEIDSQQGSAYYSAHKDSINPIRYESRKVKTKICYVCGKSFDPKGRPVKTCSEECAKRLSRWVQRRADEKRNNKKKDDDHEF